MRAAVLAAVLLVGGCAGPLTPRAAEPGTPPPTARFTVPAPGPLDVPPLRADLLVSGEDPIPSGQLDRIRDLPGVRRALAMSIGKVAVGGRTLTMAAADPAAFRRFTPETVARADSVWTRVAGGEMTVAPDVAAELETADGHLVLGQRQRAPRVHVAAYATLPAGIHAVVNPAQGDALGFPRGNALLLALADDAPASTVRRVRRIVDDATLLDLAAPAVTSPQTAYLTGGAVADVVGSFTFVPHSDGTVAVDPEWVERNIVTSDVPILGTVTCHRAMLPQLQGAMTEIVRRGLSEAVNPEEYGGCFNPRYIDRDASRGLSLHSWGIAVDLNVPGNQRGTVGEIDPEVVAVMKRWGFAWGGDWAFTDPMHFELVGLLRRR